MGDDAVLRLLTAMGASLVGVLVSVVSVFLHRHGAFYDPFLVFSENIVNKNID